MTRTAVLAFGSMGAREIAFGELTGADERASASADDLLSRLACAGKGRVFSAALSDLTMGDRDRALAALYEQLYGAEIAADAVCEACAAKFEMHFNLAALADRRRPDGRASGDPPAISLGNSRLRLPRRSDISGAPDELTARLTLSGPAPDAEAAAEAFEAADPTLNFDLAGLCPECGTTQCVAFSMARFLEAAMRRDRAFLEREVHLVAIGYHWGLAEILALSRRERQNYARLLIAEREVAAVPLRLAS